MNSFLPFVSGLAGGVADTYGKISDEDRKNKAAQNRLVADSIKTRLESDDTLTPDEQTHLLGQYLDLNGVDNKHKQSIIQASGYFRNALAEHDRKNATQGAQQGMAQGPAPLTDQAPAPQGLGDIPVQGRTGQQNAQLAPPIPNFQPQTAGQIDLPLQIQKATAMAKVTADAGIRSKLDLWDAEHKSNQNVVAETQDMIRKGLITQEEGDQRMEVAGVKPPRPGNLVVASQSVPGKEAKRLLGSDTLADGVTPIDESKDYHMTKVGNKFTDAMEAEAQYGTKQAVVNDDGSITVNFYDKQGRLMSAVKGAAYGGFGTTSRETVVEYQDPTTGKSVKEVVPLATTKSPGGIPPIPTPPPGIAGAPASTPTPTPTPDATAVPSLPVTPKRGSMGRTFLAPVPPTTPKSTIVLVPDGNGGHKEMEIRPGQNVPPGAITPTALNPTAQTRSMAEMAQTVTQQVPNLLSQIDNLKNKLGPDQGRWNQLWVNKAGMNDPAFAGLDQDLDLFSSALVRTHFGGRGGQQYREALKKNFSEAQSPEDLKARIQHAGTWIEAYAKAGSNATPNTPVPGSTIVYKEGGDTYNIPANKVKAFEAAHPNAKRQ